MLSWRYAMTTSKQIQEKLAEAIRQSGMKQADIAKAIGITQSMISNYIYGRKMPALDTLSRLCTILDLDANEILCVERPKEY